MIINKSFIPSKYIGVHFGLLLFMILPISLFASEGCPEITGTLPTREDMAPKIQSCIEARKSGNPNSISEFVCPQGEFFYGNNQAITNQTLSYSIAVNLSFNKLDTEIKTYVEKLQKNRDPDIRKWNETIQACTERIRNLYTNICGFGTLEQILNKEKDDINITTTTLYPQAMCMDLAKKKTLGWYYLQTIMMSDGVYKNQKNSTDTWMHQVKGAYARVLTSFHGYQKILERAVNKMTIFIKDPVK